MFTIRKQGKIELVARPVDGAVPGVEIGLCGVGHLDVDERLWYFESV